MEGGGGGIWGRVEGVRGEGGRRVSVERVRGRESGAISTTLGEHHNTSHSVRCKYLKSHIQSQKTHVFEHLLPLARGQSNTSELLPDNKHYS